MLKRFKDSKDGYISLNTKKFNTLVEGPSRSYSVYVFADSTKFGNSKSLSLSKRLKEVGLAAKSFVRENKDTENDNKFVVVRLVLEESKDSLQRLGIKGLQFFSFIPGTLEIAPGASINLPTKNLMTPGPVDDWKAEDIATFISATSGLSPGDLSELHQRSPFLPVFVLLFLGASTVVGYKVAQSPLIHYMPMYIIGSLIVFWFSLSGGMYNIIRGVPMVGIDRQTNKATVFMGGSGQMGAEGFIMGTSVMAFGMLIACSAMLVPRIEEAGQRRKVAYGLMLGLWILFNWITGTHMWKTGLRSSFYI